MKEAIQENYKERLSRYADLVHGNNPPGLVSKLAIYTAFLEQHAARGERLWKIEPLLYLLIRSVETDLHLSAARLLENSRRSERSIFAFLEFCINNQANIKWKAGPPSIDLLQGQLAKLKTHQRSIDIIMSRRDKFFAHLDKKYFNNPGTIYSDYPLPESDTIALLNCIIEIISEHEYHLNESISLQVAEFYRIAADNLVRNLEAGRKVNFPGQLD